MQATFVWLVVLFFLVSGVLLEQTPNVLEPTNSQLEPDDDSSDEVPIVKEEPPESSGFLQILLDILPFDAYAAKILSQMQNSTQDANASTSNQTTDTKPTQTTNLPKNRPSSSSSDPNRIYGIPDTSVPSPMEAAALPPSSILSQLSNVRDKFNYASVDCGANVLSVNREAKDATSILVGSKDRYMLNPCGVSKRFVVLELCEEIGIQIIALANYEFFSSMLKGFQVFGTNRYPAQQWTPIGNFTAQNARRLQYFVLPEPLWFKYIRIQFDSYYGEEYYCPISELRVHGTTVVDDITLQIERDSREITELTNALRSPFRVYQPPAPVQPDLQAVSNYHPPIHRHTPEPEDDDDEPVDSTKDWHSFLSDTGDVWRGLEDKFKQSLQQIRKGIEENFYKSGGHSEHVMDAEYVCGCNPEDSDCDCTIEYPDIKSEHPEHTKGSEHVEPAKPTESSEPSKPTEPTEPTESPEFTESNPLGHTEPTSTESNSDNAKPMGDNEDGNTVPVAEDEAPEQQDVDHEEANTPLNVPQVDARPTTETPVPLVQPTITVPIADSTAVLMNPSSETNRDSVGDRVDETKLPIKDLDASKDAPQAPPTVDKPEQLAPETPILSPSTSPNDDTHHNQTIAAGDALPCEGPEIKQPLGTTKKRKPTRDTTKIGIVEPMNKPIEIKRPYNPRPKGESFVCTTVPKYPQSPIELRDDVCYINITALTIPQNSQPCVEHEHHEPQQRQQQEKQPEKQHQSTDKQASIPPTAPSTPKTPPLPPPASESPSTPSTSDGLSHQSQVSQVRSETPEPQGPTKGTHSAPFGIGAAPQNIFKTLINRIKTLEINQSIAAVYIADLTTFYAEAFSKMSTMFTRLEASNANLMYVVQNSTKKFAAKQKHLAQEVEDLRAERNHLQSNLSVLAREIKLLSEATYLLRTQQETQQWINIFTAGALGALVVCVIWRSNGSNNNNNVNTNNNMHTNYANTHHYNTNNHTHNNYNNHHYNNHNTNKHKPKSSSPPILKLSRSVGNGMNLLLNPEYEKPLTPKQQRRRRHSIGHSLSPSWRTRKASFQEEEHESESDSNSDWEMDVDDEISNKYFKRTRGGDEDEIIVDPPTQEEESTQAKGITQRVLPYLMRKSASTSTMETKYQQPDLLRFLFM